MMLRAFRKLFGFESNLVRRERLKRYVRLCLEGLEDRIVPSSADLQLTQTGPATVNAGSQLTYNITVVNNGPDAAQNLTLSDFLPSQETFVSQNQTAGPAFTLSNSGNSVSDTIASLASGASATFTVTASVPSTTSDGTQLSNSASVNSMTSDPNIMNNSAMVSTTVQNQASMGVTISGPSTVNAGSQLTYTLTVSNSGPGTAQWLSLSDSLPSGETFVSQTQTAGPAFTLSNYGNSVSDSIDAMAPGASATFLVTALVDSGTTNNAILTDTASVYAMGSGSSASASTSVTVQNMPVMGVTVTGPSSVNAGADLTYTITVSNSGSSPAQAVFLDDSLPSGETFVSQSQTSGPALTLGNNGNSIADNLSSLAPGASATIVVTALVAANTPNNTVLTDTASSGAINANQTSGSTSTTVQGSSTVSITSFVVPASGMEGQDVSLSAQASSTVANAALTYTWSFGDGSSQSGVDLTDVDHSYAAPASANTPYTVLLTVSDGTDSTSTSSPITISNVSPTADAGASQTVHAGTSVLFNGTASDPGGPSDIVSRQWDFNYDGSTFVADPSATGTLTPSTTYGTPGTYVVALKVTDESGSIAQAFTTITVKPADALLVNAGPALTVTAGGTVSPSGSYSDPGGSVTPSGIAWDSDYNGSTFNPAVTGTLTPSLTYSTPGTYVLTLQITDSNGDRDQSSTTVTVLPVSYTGPTANAGSDQNVTEGSSVALAGSYSDPDGTVSPSGIAWDFNYDGADFTPQTTGSLTPSYQFSTPGSYTVALKITDSNGRSSLSSTTVTVSGAPLIVNAGSNQTVTAGQQVFFTGSFSDPGGMDGPYSYAWDFNYDGTDFNPGSASGPIPEKVFTTAGTYVVALKVSDNSGDSGLGTTTITVQPSGSLVVDAGPDQAIAEGDTAAFNGSWTDGSGTVNPSTAQWDFNYNGTFVADPSASGTLTPSHTYNTPGTYVVALQLTDSNNVTGLGLLSVSVADVPPSVDAGADQTVNQNSSVSFSGTATAPGGAANISSTAWDFDYDGNTFVADPSANGSLSPTHVYTTPGTYLVALQATDITGATSLAIAFVTVTDVPPTATITHSGPTAEGSPVTFTVSNLQDQTPGDTPTILADWTGSGSFEEMTSDEITTNPDGSLSFSHAYDQASPQGGYTTVIRLLDGNGGYTDYSQSVVVNAVTPTATFGPSGAASVIDSTVPFQFTNVNVPSLADNQAGFTYYVSVDGGSYTSSPSPNFLLPSNISAGTHTVTGYLTDSEGQSSPVYSWTGTVQAAQVTFTNNGTGQVQLNWMGSSGPVTLDANQSYQISGTASGLSVTLLTSNASYQLATNGSIDSISAAAGVTDVSLTVNTQLSPGQYAMAVGDGHVGTVSLPGGGSVVSVYSRGDLTNLTGPTGSSHSGASATDLVFQNLDGSISGLDSIANLNVAGWLGTSAAQQVLVNGGISNLSAYGIGATVIPDERFDAGDAVLQLTVGYGGVPGVIDANNVGNVQIAGNVNVINIGNLEGNFDPGYTRFMTVDKSQANKDLVYGDVGVLIFDGNSPNTVASIKATSIGMLYVAKSLTVTGTISANAIGTLQVNQDLTAEGISVPGLLLKLDVGGTLDVSQGGIRAGQAGMIWTGGDLKGSVGVASWVQPDGTTPGGGIIRVGGNLIGKVATTNGGISLIYVVGAWQPPPGAVGAGSLVQVTGAIGNIYAEQGINAAGWTIQGTSIDSVNSSKGALDLAKILASAGNIGSVTADLVKANILAHADPSVIPNFVGPNIVLPKGGSIGSVTSTKPIPENVTISADWWLGSVTVTDPGKKAEKFKVRAQGGGWQNGVQPLKINVGGATYAGSVTMSPPGHLLTLGQVAVYGSGPILQVTAANVNKQMGGTQTWSLDGPVGQTTKILNLIFTLLGDMTFGVDLKLNPVKLSNPNFKLE
jgi:uncharacterized repeat protein (TIGR01451 family)